ncbi:MAG: hypothetical protein ACOX69_10750 [Coriobacteriales bacterium]|jgi:hypothetical protein
MERSERIIILTGASAAELDRIVASRNDGFDWSRQPRIKDSNGLLKRVKPIPLPYAVKILDENELTCALTKPVHCLVARPNDRRKNKVLHGHCWSTDLPKNSLIQLSENIYVCAPEFRFLQAARALSIPRCIVFGLELAGSYISDREAEYGCRQCLPRTNEKLLKGYLSGITQKLGIKKARKAASHVLPNSRSPMESRLAAVLTIPQVHGGFGLPKPELNPKIETNPDFQKSGISEPRFCDVFYRKISLDIEYNGKQHEQGSAPERDLQRERDLLRAGISVVSLSEKSLVNPMEMARLARSIRKRLGMRHRPESDRTFKKRNQLFRTLFSGIGFGLAAA